MNDLLLKIDAKDLARVSPFVAQQDVRYYLNGVCVEPHADGAVLTATDGHTMATMLSRGSFAAKTSILAYSKRLATEVRKAAMSRTLTDARLELRDATSYAEIVATGPGAGRRVEYVSPEKPPLVDGKYPNWRAVLPSPEHIADGLPGFMRAEYIKMGVDAAVAFQLGGGRRAYHGVSFQHDGRTPGDSAIIIRSTDARDLIVVVMPMRDKMDKALPSWTSPPPPPAVPAEPEKVAA